MKDLLLTEDYDLQIKNGDFVIGDSQEQSVELLLLSKQGEFKNNPEAGCDILSAKNGIIERFLDREIRVQLDADGFQLDNMSLTEKGIDISGKYI
ncbi:hypothetical protein CLU96_1927 [Chryseobacterium sp. 52]|uniref:hypothetical protein n=1 Tax=Chryseobacterium sp. 52 TaxID=2035213 RepID=UPI000C199022|nr:hypothetical protein [Chryseobacterium sp. 52]PIF44928.1 hypothetical protein CLU96_1927 [Chryseobacterium sp. 52]